MTIPPLILDTRVVLSLYATRRIEEILRATGGPFLVAEAVVRESMYIHVVVDGTQEKEPIDLTPFLEAGVLSVVAPETEEELLSLIDFSLKLEEGEAMTCALALRRGYRIATDEKKTINLVGTHATIVGTLDLVRAWELMASADPTLTREVLIAIENRGYVPGVRHAHFAWWKRLRDP